MFELSKRSSGREARMRKTTLVLLLGLVLALFAVAGCGGDDEGSSATTDTETTTETTETDTGGSSEVGEELYASVGPGFEISLTTEGGEAITSLDAGTYTIEVNDQSDQHNFHLTGPGAVDVSTTVEEVTEIDWTVDLVAGTYHFQCDPHASSMNGDFEVTG
jgi:plastocyanin